jgi:hypothetical protein
MQCSGKLTDFKTATEKLGLLQKVKQDLFVILFC